MILMEKKISKFQVQDLLPIGMTLVVLGIALAYGLQVMSETQDDIGETECAARSDEYTTFNTTSNKCQNATSGATVDEAVTPETAEFNATVDGISGIAKLPAKLPTIVTVIVAAVIIGILVTYLAGRFMKS